MDSLDLLALHINYVGPNETYDMQKELCKNIDKIWRYKQKTEKICFDLDLDQDGLSESLSNILKFCSAQSVL